MSPIYAPGKVVLAKQFTWNETIWNPSMIQTALWLDAADATTIVSSGERISQWSDKSGNSRNATQATAAQRPKVTTAAQNGRSVVEFDPDLSSFQRLSFSLLTNIGHVFFVAKKNNVDESSFILTDGTADDLRGVNFGSNTGSNFVVQQIAGSLSTATRNIWHIAEVRTDGVNASLGIDATRTTSADSDVMTSSDIGWYRNPSGAFVNQYSFRGQIGEIIMSLTALNDTTRQRVEGYLAHKWGLTANLPAGHPYKLVGPTP
jgi:hypothetical protein